MASPICRHIYANGIVASASYLLKPPSALHHLSNEIRTTFKSVDEITPDTTTSLPYLNGVVEEVLRIFPPIPAGLQRVSPGRTIARYWVPKDSHLSCSAWVLGHSEKCFLNPQQYHPERWLTPDHPLFDSLYDHDIRKPANLLDLGREPVRGSIWLG